MKKLKNNSQRAILKKKFPKMKLTYSKSFSKISLIPLISKPIVSGKSKTVN